MLFQEMDYRDTASAPVRREAKPRAGLYILVVLVAMIGAFLFHMREAGIFACPASRLWREPLSRLLPGLRLRRLRPWRGVVRPRAGGARGGGGGGRALPRQQPHGVRLLRPGARPVVRRRRRALLPARLQPQRDRQVHRTAARRPAAEGAGLRDQRRQVLLRAGISAGGRGDAHARRARPLPGEARLAGAAPAALRGAARALRQRDLLLPAARHRHLELRRLERHRREDHRVRPPRLCRGRSEADGGGDGQRPGASGPFSRASASRRTA